MPDFAPSIDFWVNERISGMRSCLDKLKKRIQKLFQRQSTDHFRRLAHVLSCTGCHGLSFQPLLTKTVNGNSIKYGLPRCAAPTIADANGLCVHCGHPVQTSGPFYTGPYFSRPFVESLLDDIKSTPAESRLKTHKRLVGILTVMLEELDDVPLYYECDQMMNVCKTTMPKAERFRSAILNGGFRCAGSHCNPKALKTDAPLGFLWDIVRTLSAEQKRDLDKLAVGSPGRRILEVEPKAQVEFKHHPGSILQSRRLGLLRFQDNRGKCHGPKAKAKGSVNSAKAAAYADENLEGAGSKVELIEG